MLTLLQTNKQSKTYISYVRQKEHTYLLFEDIEKISLLSRNSRGVSDFLVFVFVSFLFWLLQILNDDYETEFSIPLRMKNVPNNVVLTSRVTQ